MANIFVNLLSESGSEQKNDIQHGDFYLECLPK